MGLRNNIDHRGIRVRGAYLKHRGVVLEPDRVTVDFLVYASEEAYAAGEDPLEEGRVQVRANDEPDVFNAVHTNARQEGQDHMTSAFALIRRLAAWADAEDV